MLRAAALLRLYPRAWRERYGEEFLELVGQTGLGPRVLFDVVTAASREWVRALAGSGLRGATAELGRRGLGFFALMIASVMFSQAVLLNNRPRLDLGEVRTYVDLLVVFVIAAGAARVGHAIAWECLLRGRVSGREGYIAAVPAFLFSTFVTLVITEAVGVATPFWNSGLVVCLWFAEEFARPEVIRRAIASSHTSPGRIGMAN